MNRTTRILALASHALVALGLALGLSVAALDARAQTSLTGRYAVPILEYRLTPGVYFDLVQSGSGFMLDNLEKVGPRDYFLFATVYSYDETGKAKWYNISGAWVAGTPVEIVQQQKYGALTAPVLLASGGNCFGCPYAPNTNAPVPQFGNATITQRGGASVDITLNGVTSRVNRLNLNPERLVGRWKGTNTHRDANGVVQTRVSTVDVRKRTAAERVTFWSNEGFPIPAADAIHFTGFCPIPAELTAGFLCTGTQGSAPGVQSPYTLFWDAAANEYKGVLPCNLAACRDAGGAYKPSTLQNGPVYSRLLMPDRNTITMMTVAGVPGQEVILLEEQYTRVQ